MGRFNMDFNMDRLNIYAIPKQYRHKRIREKEEEIRGVKLFRDIYKLYKEDILKYCERNALSAREIFQSPRCGNNTWVAVTYFDQTIPYNGVIDDSKPSDVMLDITLEDGKLRFKQTEHTYRLLAEKPPRMTPKTKTAARAAALA